jgi:MHS family proline/betaine transporter-like MFS transporter
MTQEPPTKISKTIVRAILASSVGNVVEWIDWAIYGLAAPFIAAQLFPKGNPVVALLQAYGVFAIGFVTRPLGAVIIGPYGDKYGRNRALVISILLMGGATGLIGMIPTYDSIGILAPLLVIVLRCIQGFALGGEWGSASAFIYELAPRNRRSFITSFRPCGTGMGYFIGTGFIALITMIMPPEVLKSWGWRIPFYLAFLTALLGLYLRLKVIESPEFEEAKAKNETSNNPLGDTVKFNKRGMAVVFGIAMIWNSVYLVIYTYLPVHLSKFAGMTYSAALRMCTIALLLYTVMVPIFGWVADNCSKKLLLTISTIGFTVFTYPAFMLIGTGNYWAILFVFLAFSVLMGIYGGAAQMVFAEQFPTGTRNTAMSLAYTVNVTLLGGTAPLTVTWLVSALKDPMAAAYYTIACSLVAVFAVRYATYTTDEQRMKDKAMVAIGGIRKA